MSETGHGPARRILQFTDVHFGREHAPAVAAALEYARATPHDLTLITGDITQAGKRREFLAAAEWIRALPGAVLVTVGNHDTPWNPLDRTLWPWRRFERATGHPAHDHEFRSDGLAVRGLATARGWQARLNWSKGVADIPRTRRAANALKDAAPGTLRVLACHHPLLDLPDAVMTGSVRRGREAARILVEARVDLIVTGHTHAPFVHPLGIGDRRTYAVGGGTLSHRERGAAPGFNRIEWNEREITVAAMVWRGDGFHDDRVWTQPRRS